MKILILTDNSYWITKLAGYYESLLAQCALCTSKPTQAIYQQPWSQFISTSARSRITMAAITKRLSYMASDDWKTLTNRLLYEDSGWYNSTLKHEGLFQDMLLAAQELLRSAYDNVDKQRNWVEYDVAIKRTKLGSEEEVDAMGTWFLFDEMRKVTDEYRKVCWETERLREEIERRSEPLSKKTEMMQKREGGPSS